MLMTYLDNSPQYNTEKLFFKDEQMSATDYHVVEALRDMSKQTNTFHNRNKRFLQTLIDNIHFIL